MKFFQSLMIIPKVTEKKGFILFLKITFPERLNGCVKLILQPFSGYSSYQSEIATYYYLI